MSDQALRDSQRGLAQARVDHAIARRITWMITALLALVVFGWIEYLPWALEFQDTSLDDCIVDDRRPLEGIATGLVVLSLATVIATWVCWAWKINTSNNLRTKQWAYEDAAANFVAGRGDRL